jgi:hypothetical protein
MADPPAPLELPPALIPALPARAPELVAPALPALPPAAVLPPLAGIVETSEPEQLDNPSNAPAPSKRRNLASMAASRLEL